MTREEIAAHRLECDGEPGEPPFPGMQPMPCIICHPRKWERWDEDPYGYSDAKCCRCGGVTRERAAKVVLLDHVHIASFDLAELPEFAAVQFFRCRTCGVAVGRDGQALTLEQHIELRASARTC